ncbi:MAG: 2Fe-2S iron-sulfur cluster-binding protein [Chloroflexota bacterium]
MPKLIIDGKTADVADGKRLINAIKEAGVNIGHRCGGNGKCTTCRVEFEAGEPEAITKAEYEKLVQAELLGTARLACQIACDADMSMASVMTLENMDDWIDTGLSPKDDIMPELEWMD